MNKRLEREFGENVAEKRGGALVADEFCRGCLGENLDLNRDNEK
jgi:hypothetical protein